MTNRCFHQASGEWRSNDSCLIQSLTTDVMTATVGNVTAYHFAVASMISPWLVCRAAAWVRAEEHTGALEKSSLLHKIPLQSSAVGEGREKARADLMQLLLSSWVGQEGSSTYLPEPSRAFCFLLLWIPASCPGSLPSLSERWHCSGVSSLSVLFWISPKLAYCWKYALWVEKSSCSNAWGFQ